MSAEGKKGTGVQEYIERKNDVLAVMQAALRVTYARLQELERLLARLRGTGARRDEAKVRRRIKKARARVDAQNDEMLRQQGNISRARNWLRRKKNRKK